jgi:uncharacterized membrane-anchored protein
MAQDTDEKLDEILRTVKTIPKIIFSQQKNVAKSTEEVTNFAEIINKGWKPEKDEPRWYIALEKSELVIKCLILDIFISTTFFKHKSYAQQCIDHFTKTDEGRETLLRYLIQNV